MTSHENEEMTKPVRSDWQRIYCLRGTASGAKLDGKIIPAMYLFHLILLLAHGATDAKKDFPTTCYLIISR